MTLLNLERPEDQKRLETLHTADPTDLDVSLTLIRDSLRHNKVLQAALAWSRTAKANSEVGSKILANLPQMSESEIIKFRIALDYSNCVEVLNKYEILEPNQTFYISDYEATKGQKFKIPSLDQILKSLTKEDLELYKKMEENQWEPKLQLTPIGLDIHTMENNIQGKTAINAKVFASIDTALTYEPTSYNCENLNILQIVGGKSKAQWIADNKGWLVDIVATKQELPADSYNQSNEEATVLTFAEKVKRYHDTDIANGYSEPSVESYFMTATHAFDIGKPLKDNECPLLSSAMSSGLHVIVANSTENAVVIYAKPLHHEDKFIVRLSRRIELLPLEKIDNHLSSTL